MTDAESHLNKQTICIITASYVTLNEGVLNMVNSCQKHSNNPITASYFPLELAVSYSLIHLRVLLCNY